MKALRILLRLPLAASLAVGFATIGFVAWFFPWVLTLHAGLLLYFPYEPDGTMRYARLAGPVAATWKGDWVPSHLIPAACKKALVASEDAKFFYHNGLDLESIEESYRANERGGRIARGGSTITQQLVKNAFLSRDKSYLRKVREVAGALLLDATLSKDDQLTWYFNVVEFGPRVYGLESAARFYFDKHAAQLDKRQCASLVAVLPAPNRWNVALVKKRRTPFFARRTATILARMEHVKLGADEEVRRSLARERRPLSLRERASLAADEVRSEKKAASTPVAPHEEVEGGEGSELESMAPNEAKAENPETGNAGDVPTQPAALDANGSGLDGGEGNEDLEPRPGDEEAGGDLPDDSPSFPSVLLPSPDTPVSTDEKREGEGTDPGSTENDSSTPVPGNGL